MKRKVYKAETVLSLSVNISGGRRRICFDALSGTGSMYMTSNENIQTALENHPYFGKHFRLFSSVEVNEKGEDINKIDVLKNAVAEGNAAPAESGGAKSNVIKVSGPDDAASFLIENYNVSRTKLRTLDQIKKAAEEKGIKFEGI